MKLKNNVKLLIAVDGGAGSGKTTGSKLIAKKYGLKLLTSGLLYRFIAYKLLKAKKIKSKKLFLKKITKEITLKDLKNRNLFGSEITKYTMEIAKIKRIRDLLKNYQLNFAKNKLCIIEGRDIGTIIIPKADLKLFFKCSLNTKAKRRFEEYRKTNKKILFNDVKKAIKLRDSNDSKRKISPLKPAKDAVIVDTSKVNKKQMLTKLSKIIEKKLKEKYGRNL
jgi:cytidylate kinase|tara:strand:+ start:1354 stop:2019 length:666 start_codon:yes stop_codon:yes gene_type:complete